MATRQASPIGPFPGLLQQGNIDLAKRPVVHNPDGSYSTVRSMSFENNGGQEILVPTVSPDGKILSNRDAMQLYGDTGQNLGKFDNPAHADMYAEALHKAQDQFYGAEAQPGGNMADLARIKSNVAKMAAQNAPEEDIDGYIASEGVTVDDVRNFKPQSAPAGNNIESLIRGTEQAPAPSVGSDVAHSAATGLRQGVESMIGGFGDANKMSGDLAGWAAGKLGFGETGQNVASWIGSHATPTAMMPSTDDIRQLTVPTIGENYQPQTVAGEYARTAGQFAPGAALGPGGLMRKAAMTVVPALASETAGQLTKGTDYEGPARFVGGLAGGVAAAGRNVSPKGALPAARTADDLAAEANSLYKKADQAGVTIKAPATTKLAANIEFAAGRLNDKLRPNTQGIVEDAKAMAGKDVSLQELDEFRQTVGQAMERAQPQDARTLGQIKKVVDNFADNASPADISGDVKGFDLIKQARSVWAKKAKVDTLNQIVEKAKNQATGFENGIVTQMRSLANNPSRLSQFTKAEQAMIKSVVRRGNVHGILRAIGMMAPNSTFGGLANLGVAGASGLLPGALTAGVGAAAKYGAGKLTTSKMGQLQRAASTGVAPATGPAPLNVDALVRTLLNAQSSGTASAPVK